MGGFFGIVSEKDCLGDVFFGTAPLGQRSLLVGGRPGRARRSRVAGRAAAAATMEPRGAHTTTKGWANHLTTPLAQILGHTPALAPYKETACTSLRSE